MTHSPDVGEAASRSPVERHAVHHSCESPPGGAPPQPARRPRRLLWALGGFVIGGGLVGLLVDRRHRLGVLPPTEPNQIRERCFLQVIHELPPQAVPAEPFAVIDLRQGFGSFPPVPDQMS